MMKLTEIRQGRTENRLLLVFDNGRKLPVWKQTAAEYGLFPDKEVSEEEFSLLEQTAQKQRIKERAVRIVSASNVSGKGLARKLIQKGETPEDSEQAVQWLEDLALLDDRRTGEAIVRSALNKGYGKRRICQILREKEIPQEYWEELLSELPPMDETIDKLLRQRLKYAEPDKKTQQRAVDALLRYGHSWTDIRAGLERFRVSIDLEDEQCL